MEKRMNLGCTGTFLGNEKNRCPTVAQNENFSLIYRLSLIRSMIL